MKGNNRAHSHDIDDVEHQRALEKKRQFLKRLVHSLRTPEYSPKMEDLLKLEQEMLHSHSRTIRKLCLLLIYKYFSFHPESLHSILIPWIKQSTLFMQIKDFAVFCPKGFLQSFSFNLKMYSNLIELVTKDYEYGLEMSLDSQVLSSQFRLFANPIGLKLKNENFSSFNMKKMCSNAFRKKGIKEFPDPSETLFWIRVPNLYAEKFCKQIKNQTEKRSLKLVNKKENKGFRRSKMNIRIRRKSKTFYSPQITKTSKRFVTPHQAKTSLIHRNLEHLFRKKNLVSTSVDGAKAPKLRIRRRIQDRTSPKNFSDYLKKSLFQSDCRKGNNRAPNQKEYIISNVFCRYILGPDQDESEFKGNKGKETLDVDFQDKRKNNGFFLKKSKKMGRRAKKARVYLQKGF